MNLIELSSFRKHGSYKVLNVQMVKLVPPAATLIIRQHMFRVANLVSILIAQRLRHLYFQINRSRTIAYTQVEEA